MVTFPNETNVSMLQFGSLMNLWENWPQPILWEDEARPNLWVDSEVVNMRIGNEEWTVSWAVMEAKQWNPEDLWENLVIADSAENFQGTTIGCKRKALTDLWSEEQQFHQVDHLTRSGRIYLPPNFQTRESSHPVAPSNTEPFHPFTPPTKEPFCLEKNPVAPEEMLKRQLEQTQAKMSVWNVLVQSTRHCERLIQTLSHLKAPLT